MRTLLLCLLAASALLAACKESAGTGGNSSPQPSPPSAANAATGATTPGGAQPTAGAGQATNAEARASLERVYQRAVAVDESRPDPFVTGDFNGDGSGDIAVAVKPAGDMLGELNSEFPNWIVADPRAAVPLDPNKTKQAPPPAPGPVKIEQGDGLLVIVHGHGPEGWRSPQATQSYLLKGVAAQGLRSVPVMKYPPALAVRRNLNAKSDIISGKLAGADGFLYWSRGKYIWHKP